MALLCGIKNSDETITAWEKLNIAEKETEKSLRSGALGLGDIFMQAITHTAPATAILFTIPFITSKAGVAITHQLFICIFSDSCIGCYLTQLAKHLPSAGGYYTYISHTISPRAGFLTSWLYFLYDPTIAGYSLAFVGAVTEETLRVNYGINFPWWLFLLITGPLFPLLHTGALKFLRSSW